MRQAQLFVPHQWLCWPEDTGYRTLEVVHGSLREPLADSQHRRQTTAACQWDASSGTACLAAAQAARRQRRGQEQVDANA